MVMDVVVSVILLFVGIAVLVTIHVCVAGRALRRGFNNGTIDVERNTSGSPSMSQDEIKKLPCFGYKVEEKGKSPVECAVCLENFKVGDMCRLLPNCKHSFHSQCIDSWLSKTAACPICRTEANLPKIGEQSSNSSQVGVELV